jgi:hypothetical protein
LSQYAILQTYKLFIAGDIAKLMSRYFVPNALLEEVDRLEG